MLYFLEYSGSGLAIIGAFLVANHTQYSKYGYILFLLSSLMLMPWGYLIDAWGILTQQIIFCIINAWGVYRWFNPSVKHNI